MANGRESDEGKPKKGRTVQLRVVEKRDPDVPMISKKQLQQLLEETGGHLVSTVPTKAGAARRDRTRKLDVEAFRKAFAEDEDLVAWVTQPPEKFSADGPEQVVATAEGKKVVRLLNPDSFLRDLLIMKAQLADKSFQIHHYGELLRDAESQVKRLPADRQATFTGVLRKLPPAEKLVHASIKDIAETIQSLVDAILDFFGWGVSSPPSTATRPATCAQEEGTGFGGDSGGSPNTANPAGLLATNEWPLKQFTTCVRDQGRRGTCTSFGIAGAAEARIAAQEGRWVNLSEQDLYMHQKFEWFPLPPDWYGDGYNAVYATILQTLAVTYTFPFERDWDYNKSTHRQSYDLQREYTNSCNNYTGEACSDTNHQAALIACYGIEETELIEEEVEICGWGEEPLSEQVGIGGLFGNIIDFVAGAAEWVCETVTQLRSVVTGYLELCVYETTIPATSGFRISGSMPLWVKTWTAAGDWSTVKSHLNLHHPVIFCFKVVESFGNHDGGYVAYDSGEDNDGGGHCALITGFVDNADLPAGAPAGAGGGYFVVKNSWGADSGDQGYWYVPYDWAQHWGAAMIAVTAVS